MNVEMGEGSLVLHREVERLMAEADFAHAAGREVYARRLWRHAGEVEVQVFSRLPHDRPRTRGTIAVSAASLLLRGGQPEEAARRARQWLEPEEELPEWATETLRDLIRDVERGATK